VRPPDGWLHAAIRKAKGRDRQMAPIASPVPGRPEAPRLLPTIRLP
jgi:hypothetical protein